MIEGVALSTMPTKMLTSVKVDRGAEDGAASPRQARAGWLQQARVRAWAGALARLRTRG